LKKVDVDRYVKPLRKKWKSWANWGSDAPCSRRPVGGVNG